jgi:hypothetical protein
MPKPYVGKYRTCKWLFDLLPQCGRARTLVRNRKTLTAKKKIGITIQPMHKFCYLHTSLQGPKAQTLKPLHSIKNLPCLIITGPCDL